MVWLTSVGTGSTISSVFKASVLVWSCFMHVPLRVSLRYKQWFSSQSLCYIGWECPKYALLRDKPRPCLGLKRFSSLKLSSLWNPPQSFSRLSHSGLQCPFPLSDQNVTSFLRILSIPCNCTSPQLGPAL